MTNEEAIKILEECLGQGQFFDTRLKQAYDKAIEALKDERAKGEWIEHQDCYDDTYYTCSHCGEDWITIEGKPTDNLMNYCPMCGADMRED